MDGYPPKIVKLLQQQRRFHQEQLRLIDLALAAIESSPGTRAGASAKKKAKVGPVRKHRIQWTREIGRRLDDYDEFTIMDLQSDLAETGGITSAMTLQGRNVINNTLNRFENKGRIQKVRPGFYRVVKESLPT